MSEMHSSRRTTSKINMPPYREPLPPMTPTATCSATAPMSTLGMPRARRVQAEDSEQIQCAIWQPSCPSGCGHRASRIRRGNDQYPCGFRFGDSSGWLGISGPIRRRYIWHRINTSRCELLCWQLQSESHRLYRGSYSSMVAGFDGEPEGIWLRCEGDFRFPDFRLIPTEPSLWG